MDGLRWDGSLKEDSFAGFVLAIVLFALATSLFFTPLPIFLRDGLHLSTSWVYVAYILNSVGGTTGYFLIGRKAHSMDIRKQMPRFVLLRSVLIFSLVGVILFAFSAHNHDGYSADFHRVRLRHVLHHDAFPLNGGYTSGKSRALRRNGQFRISFWRLPWTLPCFPPELRSMFVITAVVFLVAFLTLKLFR